MSVTHGFFDSVNGDRIYNSNDFSNYFKGLIGNGIYKDFLGGLQVTADTTTGLGLIVKSGKATIDGRWILNDSDLNLTVAAGGTSARNDYVVVQLNLSERLMAIKVISNEEYFEDDTSVIKNLPLARILIRKNATSINGSDITDMRPVAGFVTGLIDQVDTEELFTQFEAAIAEKEAEFDAYFEAKKTAFDNWFTQLTSDLIVNTIIKEQHKKLIVSSDAATAVTATLEECSISDIVDVHLNGVWLIRDEDFTVSQVGSSIQINVMRGFSKGDVIDIRVLKSEIGDDVLTDAGEVLYI